MEARRADRAPAAKWQNGRISCDRKWTRPKDVSSGKTGGSVDPYRNILWTPVVLCHQIYSSLGSCYRGQLSEFSCKTETSGQGGSAGEETKVNLVRAVIRLIRRMEFQDPRTGDSGPDYCLALSRIISSAKKD